jgi:D-glycero-D-manno-heptose 1,7-bisphosphate phosphatase
LKQKAIFLDRDGIINYERKDYVKNLDEFKIYDGIIDAIKILKNNNFLVIIITNQSAINRKLLSISTLNHIHENFQKFLKDNDTSIDAIYFCPHTPEDLCACRKPKPGLLLSALNDFDIDLTNSFMIGDSLSDINAAKAINCNWILLKNGKYLLSIVKNLVSTN